MAWSTRRYNNYTQLQGLKVMVKEYKKQPELFLLLHRGKSRESWRTLDVRSGLRSGFLGSLMEPEVKMRKKSEKKDKD